MSTTEQAIHGEDSLAVDPEFELACLYDDMGDPTEVTVFFPRGERTATEWITADVTTAVGLDQVR